MLTVILAMVGIVIYVILLFTYLHQDKTAPNGVLFGITLPAAALQDVELSDLRAGYKRSFLLPGLLGLAALLPVLVLGNFFSLQFIAFFLWVPTIFLVLQRPFLAAHRSVRKLKETRGWYVGEKRQIHIDTMVSQLKSTLGLSPRWFIPPLCGAVLVNILAQHTEMALRIICGVTLFIMLLYFGLFLGMKAMKTKVYSTDSGINLALNKVNRRYWSQLWLVLSWLELLRSGLLLWIFPADNINSTALLVVTLTTLTLFPLIGILYTHHKLREKEERISSADTQPLYTDDDEFWRNGSHYYNENDRSVMVPKRFGIGTTLNLATRTGKLLQYGSLGGAAVLMIVLSLFFLRMDYEQPRLVLLETAGTVSIQSFGYGYEFETSAIQEVKLVSELTVAKRTNGIATPDYMCGHFKLDHYGKARVYVYKKNPPYLAIRLADGYVIYNAKHPQETEQLYRQLLPYSAQAR